MSSAGKKMRAWCSIFIAMQHPPFAAPSDVTRNRWLALVYFLLSTALTWWFIKAGAGLYASREKMMLSCGIAGAKWALQIGAALLLLRRQRWPFIRRLGEVCLAGSLMLLPYCFAPVRDALGERGFLASLMAAVALMIGLYWRAVRGSRISSAWFWGWIVCLAVAVTLQVTVVFG